MDTSYPIVPVNQDGGINMGDWDGDGNMDIIVGGYIGTRDANAPACYSSPLRVYENKPEKNGLKGNTFPDAPATCRQKCKVRTGHPLGRRFGQRIANLGFAL